jgi:hypothetical protein
MSGQRALPPDDVRVPPDRHQPSTLRVRLTVAAVGVLSLASLGAVIVGSAGSTPVVAASKAVTAVPTSEPSDDVDLSSAPPSDPPTGLGDDAALDELAQSCHDGDLLACDHLYLQSPVDSDYEDYGDTCAGRQDAGTENYCALGTGVTPGPETEPSGEPVPPEGLGSDPDLDALAQTCYAGDMDACDQLYAEAAAGSDYEIYGDTCAGRQPENTGQYCRDLDNVVPGTGVEPTTTAIDDTTITAIDDTTTTELDDTTTTELDDTTTTELDDTTTTELDDTTTGEPVPPEGLGSDPELDALAQSCYAGDMDACDDLYFESELGSDYQVYGDTCAGRQPEGTGTVCTDLETVVPGTGVEPTTTAIDVTTTEFEVTTTTVFDGPATTAPEFTTTVPGAPTTTPGIDTTQPALPGTVPPPTQEPTGLGTDPALDALAESCFDGDLAACDDLFRTAPPDTPYRAYGDTCAGRQPENTGIWCTDAFGDDTTTSVVGDTTTSVVGDTSTTPVTTAPPVPTPPPLEPTTTLPGTSLPVPTDPLGPTTTVPGVIPPPTLEPTGLGDDPNLDALAQRCYDGNMEACDDLWEQSIPDSAYRNYGDTCAGRQPPNTGVFCVVAFPPGGATPTTTLPGETVPATSLPGPAPSGDIPPASQQPTGLGDDPNLDALAQSCYDGDMQACDDLFDQAPVGSAYFEYGDTCAGRQPAKTFNYCRVTFPSDPRRP